MEETFSIHAAVAEIALANQPPSRKSSEQTFIYSFFIFSFTNIP